LARKSHKLSAQDVFDFKLIGISSHENDYHICWLINHSLDFHLNKREDLHAFNVKFNLSQDFSLYSYYDEGTLTDYHLISNRCDDGFLLEEMRNIDFIMKITGEVDDRFMNELIMKLRTLEVVTTAFELEPKKLKSREKLVF
jgi:hypothetical protein